MKKRQRKVRLIRAAIQFIFFIVAPALFSTAFAGVKSIFQAIAAGQPVTWNSFLDVTGALLLITVLFGRHFCGYACAFGSLGDAMYELTLFIRQKVFHKKGRHGYPEKVVRCLQKVKYILLAFILLSIFTGWYANLQGMSPWDVFSMIHAGNLKLANYIPGLIILLLILVGMCVQERFFCRFLCPMGAIFSLLPVLPIFSLRRDRSSCIPKCSGCTRKCPSDIQLPDNGSWEISADCFQCQKCMDVCPKSNVHCAVNDHFRKITLRGNEIIFTVLRALLLLGIFILLGI